MRARWKITLGLAALLVISGFLLLGGPSRAERALEKTRLSLRQQGFKTDLEDFDLSTSPDERRRAAVLAKTTWAAITNRTAPGPILNAIPGLMVPAGTNKAVVIWQLEKFKSDRVDDLWPELRQQVRANRTRIDDILQAALAGPIRFEPIGKGAGALLPYLADLKNLEATFGLLTMVALHDGQKDTAWEDLRAATCLVTSYIPEPLEISHLVRFGCFTLAFDTTWNALQSRAWNDVQLAELQRRWEAVDFLSGLAETSAFARANMAASCQLERAQPIDNFIKVKDVVHSPKDSWYGLKGYLASLRYRHQGLYEDERSLLLYFRDRELEVRQALRCQTWQQMRPLPGVTNSVPFVTKNPSPILAIMNMRQLSLRWQGEGMSFLSRAASAEARRRLIIIAIALERFRGRQGAYPQALQDLVPELLASLPTDFMDGKAFRYRRTNDGHFLLYSVGLDCVDNGGEMRKKRRGMPGEIGFEFGGQSGTDLVWPRPASMAEIEQLRKEELETEMKRIAREQEVEAAAKWHHSDSRQARVEAILEAAPVPRTNAPDLRWRLPTELLRNEETSGANESTRANILTLRQLITGFEPEIVTFELPISYDVLTNVGTLGLRIDPTPDPDSDESSDAQYLECNRAKNGNCLLLWSTIYESPGKHALQAVLLLNDAGRPTREFDGPLAPFLITNLCQFTLSSGHFEHETGATLCARLPESNGTYVVEFNSHSGQLLKTINGTSSNSLIKVHWDLSDDHGNVYTNDEFDTVFHIILPASGRSQRLRGP